MKLELPYWFRRIYNALPDVNEHPPEQQATAGMVASILLHIGIFVFWLSVQSGWIDNLIVPVAKPEQQLDLIIQTVAPTVSEKVVLPLDQLSEKSRVDSAGLEEAKNVPTVSTFQSDKNLAAGSQQRPTGSAPVPTVNGRSKVAEKVLVKQEAKAGSLDAEQAKPASALSKLAGNNSGAKATAASKKQAPKHQAGGDAQRAEELAELGGELVFRKIAAGPSNAKQSDSTSSQASKTEVAQTKTVSASEAIDDLFQEGKEKSEMKGGLAENGKTGVNASKTPMGVYMKSVSRAIGARWNDLVKNKMDSLETGLVKVRFWITPDGTVRKVVVERSTANRQFSDVCLEAVQAAKLEPPPVEAQPLLQDGLLEIPFTFSLY